MKFEIAKKIEKQAANVKGISLRSVKADSEGAHMVIVAERYGDIKSAVENYRMMTNTDISFRMRGKSIEIFVAASPDAAADSCDAVKNLALFASGLSFNSEDASDVIEFCCKYLPLEEGRFIDMEMDQSRLRISIESDGFDQEKLMEKLDPYSMGLIKQDLCDKEN